MASLIKTLLRLKPAQGFGANLPRKARKRRAHKSLRRDRAIAKARRAEAKAFKMVARATRQQKLAADTLSARAEAANRKDLLEAFLLAKAEREEQEREIAKAISARRDKYKESLYLPGEIRVASAEGIAAASTLKKRVKPSAPVLLSKRARTNRKIASLLSRERDLLVHATAVAVARPGRPVVRVVAGTVGK